MFACCNPRLKKNRHTYTRLRNVYFWGLLLPQHQLCYLARHNLSPQGLRDGLLWSGPMWGDSHLEEQGYQEVRQLQGWCLSASVLKLLGLAHWAMPQLRCHTENKVAIMWSGPREETGERHVWGRTYFMHWENSTILGDRAHLKVIKPG